MKRAVYIILVITLSIMLAAPCDSVSAAQSGTAEKTMPQNMKAWVSFPRAFHFPKGSALKTDTACPASRVYGRIRMGYAFTLILLTDLLLTVS